MLRSRLVGAIGALVLVAAAGTATAEVYVTSPNKGQILVLDSTGKVTRTIGGAGTIVQPFGIAMDSRRNLLVADYSAGRILRFSLDGSSTVVASNIPRPDGLSVSASGEIFLVSRDNRTAAAAGARLKASPGRTRLSNQLRHVWMIPPDSGPPVLVGKVEESFRLAQTQSVDSGTYKGDLLVLSTRPGLVARFARMGSRSFSRRSDFIGYVPGEPTSMAFTRNHELLISTSDGRVLRYSDTGVQLQPDFATGLPVGPTSVAISSDGIVHVTPIGSSSILRFDPYGSRLPALSTYSSSISLAVSLIPGCVPTPVGQNVNVSLAPGVNVVFDNVVSAGQTCLVTTSLGPGVLTSPNNNTIPSFALKLWEDPGFVVYDVTTTALFTDTISEEFFSPNPDARLLVAHGSGGDFNDNTVLVTQTDPRGRTGQLSEFVLYLDTRPNLDVILLKLADLQNVVNTFGPIINPSLVPQIQTLVSEVTTAIGSGGSDADRPGAIELLKALKTLIRENSGEGIPNRPGPDGGGNAAGTLVSFADTLIFQLSL